MTIFTYLLISCSQEKHQRQKSDNRVRIFQPQCYGVVAVLRMGYAEVVFIQPGGKLDTMMWCLAKTS